MGWLFCGIPRLGCTVHLIHWPFTFQLGTCRTPLGIDDDVGTIQTEQSRFAKEPCFAGTGAADDQNVEISPMFVAVEADADMGRQNDIVLKRLQVGILAAESLWIAPLGRTIFHAGSAVLTGAVVHGNCHTIGSQPQQQEAKGVGLPLDGKGVSQQKVEPFQQQGQPGAILISGGQQQAQPENGNGKSRPQRGGSTKRGALPVHGSAPRL